jgi:hypothetical protein
MGVIHIHGHTQKRNQRGLEFTVSSILVELRSVHESDMGLIVRINGHHFAKHC